MIGLEVHVYLPTRSKLFCRCSADFLSSPAPNTQVCHVCTGQPGAKPLAPNAAAMEGGVRLARALAMTLGRRTRFLRKHYFYPDLPSNYQRTSEPLATGGTLAGCALTEVHVEEDPGAYDPAAGTVDYDRAGAPLLELVTEPQLDSPAHARRFLAELRLALRYLGLSREEAGMKADCNVSVRGGARVEVKNVNSARNVERALAHEIERQSREGAVRETRHFDEDTGRTTPMRTKESEADYRFLPDPDLRPVDLDALQRALPPEESPFARRARIAQLASVTEEEASPLLDERGLADLYEANPTRTRFRFLVRDLRAELEHRATTLAASGVPLNDLSALVAAREEERITPQVATRLLRHALDHRGLGNTLVEELGHAAADPGDALVAAARAAIAANPRAVADHRAGKQGAVNFLVGQAMRQLKGRADANALRSAVEDALRQ